MHYRALPRLATEGKRAMGEGKFWTMINKQPTRAELLATIEHRFARMGNFASNGYAQTETKPTQEAPPRATAEYKQVYVRQCAACGGDHRMGACDSFPATWRVVQK
jgi:mono/diheme cytochrome c family protein